MSKTIRIGILGIGGVGGFIGGKLAAHYHGGNKEIIFIARGEHERVMKNDGLRLKTHSNEQVIHPATVTNLEDLTGVLDVVIFCVKAYHLEVSATALAKHVNDDTVILPLLNGADITSRIQNILPQCQVLDGCIYLVSKLVAPGVVEQKGEFYSVHIGSDTVPAETVLKTCQLIKDAGINTTLEDNISNKVWAKFSFISPIATYTSAFNISIGAILDDAAHLERLQQLMAENIHLANALGIEQPPDIISRNETTMRKLPYETTSSMQADFANGRQTEMETLTGYVVHAARKHGVSLPLYEELYRTLLHP